MGIKAGNLLWNRMRIDIPFSTNIDTGLTQQGKAFASMSPGEPPLGVVSTVPPPDGTLPASRIQVIPLAPLSKWTNVTHSEPYYDPTTNTVHVRFAVSNEGSVTDLNVLFWDPHSIAGPGEADTYNP